MPLFSLTIHDALSKICTDLRDMAWDKILATCISYNVISKSDWGVDFKEKSLARKMWRLFNRINRFNLALKLPYDGSFVLSSCLTQHCYSYIIEGLIHDEIWWEVVSLVPRYHWDVVSWWDSLVDCMTDGDMTLRDCVMMRSIDGLYHWCWDDIIEGLCQDDIHWGVVSCMLW